MTEIKGYENYTIDRDGKIWSKKSDRFLKPIVANKGYLMVGLYKNGKKKTFGIYHLLALAFIPNPENKLEVDHIDRNPSNNSLSNLKWATRKEQLENRGAYGEIRHKFISYYYHRANGYKYYRIQKRGYFTHIVNVKKFTLKDALDLRMSLLSFYKLPYLSSTE